MRNELRATLRFSKHVREVTTKYFELRRPETNFDPNDLQDFATFRSYYKELFIDGSTGHVYSIEQQYLRDLQELIAPIISSYALKARIPRLKPRTNQIGASTRLERTGHSLSFESYHFKARLKNFGKSASLVIPASTARQNFSVRLSKIVRRFSAGNERLLRYRNFVVHGPTGRFDEFSALRSWELGGTLHHADLWHDYNTAFFEVQQDWDILAKSLIKSMEECVARIQHLNETFLELRLINLVATSRQEVA
jgi:hypothetical protein